MEGENAIAYKIGQYGVRQSNGFIYTENHLLTITDVMAVTHGFGVETTSEWGELVRWTGDVWEVVE